MVARRATQTPLLPICHHSVQKLSWEHLPWTPFVAATEVPVFVLPGLIGVLIRSLLPVVLISWIIVAVIALAKGD